MQPQTIADIVGDNAQHQLSTTSLRARSVTISATGGAVRAGDVNTGAARGFNIAQNTSFTFPPEGADISASYDLSKIYLYIPSGATASIGYVI